jgi:hypothetical protein
MRAPVDLRCVAKNTWPCRLSNPAMTTCVCQRNQEAVWASKGGKLPTTNSSLRSRNLRNLCSLRNLCRLCTLCSLCSRSLCSRSRELPGPSPEAILCSPYRRHRTSPG